MIFQESLEMSTFSAYADEGEAFRVLKEASLLCDILEGFATSAQSLNIVHDSNGVKKNPVTPSRFWRYYEEGNFESETSSQEEKNIYCVRLKSEEELTKAKKPATHAGKVLVLRVRMKMEEQISTKFRILM